MTRRLAEGRTIVLICAAGLAVCVAVMLLALAVGSVSIPLPVTARILAAPLLRDGAAAGTDAQQIIILRARMPRVLVAGLVGAALAFAGTLMQGLFRNPLASPGVLGVSAGAALGAVIAIGLGLAARYAWSVPAFAFAGALATMSVVYALASSHGETPLATLLLAGMAVTALAGSATSLVIVLTAQDSVEVSHRIVLWTMGGLESVEWRHLRMVGPPLALAVAGGVFFLRDLNIMLMGEEQAQTLGVHAERLKMWILTFASLATGAAVAVSGLVGFVGLVVPHMMRFLVGPDHRRLVPASLFGGAAFVVLMDLLARVIARPEEMRLGILTGAVGAPFFLLLLIRHRREASRL